jgi:hypothetical protein
LWFVFTSSHGEVEWRLGHRRYLIKPDTLLLLPDGDEYSLTIDSVKPSRGFCAVFRRGLVEECWRAAVSKQETLLGSPHDVRPLPFWRRLESRTGPLGRAIDALAAAVAANALPDTLGWLFESLGEKAADSVSEQRRESFRPTAIRAATRLEIHRRLHLARQAIEDDLAAPWTLVTIGRAATMEIVARKPGATVSARHRPTEDVRYERKVTDGQGLYLLVTPKGALHWRFRYRFAGKCKTLALGSILPRSYSRVGQVTAQVIS